MAASAARPSLRLKNGVSPGFQQTTDYKGVLSTFWLLWNLLRPRKSHFCVSLHRNETLSLHKLLELRPTLLYLQKRTYRSGSKAVESIDVCQIVNFSTPICLCCCFFFLVLVMKNNDDLHIFSNKSNHSKFKRLLKWLYQLNNITLSFCLFQWAEKY